MAALAFTVLWAGWAFAYTVTARNNCSHDILVRGLAGSQTLDNRALPARTATKISETSYPLPVPWIGGRVYGCWDPTAAAIDIHDGAALQRSCGLVELTVSNAAGNLSSNISFVDFISIPLRIEAAGTFCTNNGVSTAAFDPEAVIKGCPTKLLNGRVCMSANQYCSDATYGDPGSAYCKALDGIIAKCQGNAKAYPGCSPPSGDANTTAVYGCKSGTFWEGGAGQQYCMAINRGILPDPKWQDIQGDPGKFYPSGGTYNTYAKFVHDTAGPIFALSYDDYPSHLNQGGYLNCQTSTSWTITFCPGAPAKPAALPSGATTGVARSSSSDRLQLEGAFHPSRDIDLRLESVRLEALLAEPRDGGDEP